MSDEVVGTMEVFVARDATEQAAVRIFLGDEPRKKDNGVFVDTPLCLVMKEGTKLIGVYPSAKDFEADFDIEAPKPGELYIADIEQDF